MIRISEHQLHHLMARLSERAITVLRFLAQQRFATTSHPTPTAPASETTSPPSSPGEFGRRLAPTKRRQK